jgi:hypothetical protein
MNIKRLPESDPARVFFRLEADVHSIVDYMAVICHVMSDPKSIDPDIENGIVRLLSTVQDHAFRVQAGFREAFPTAPQN